MLPVGKAPGALYPPAVWSGPDWPRGRPYTRVHSVAKREQELFWFQALQKEKSWICTSVEMFSSHRKSVLCLTSDLSDMRYSSQVRKV